MPPPSSNYQAPAPTGYVPPPEHHSNGLAIAGLIIGIFAVILGFTIVGGTVLGVLALIFGFLGKKKATTNPSVGGRGMAIAGIVLGFIGIATAILVIVLFVTLFATVTSPFWFYSY